jgi:predicted transcriptional regulator
VQPAVAEVRFLLARRLVMEVGIPQAEAPRLLGVTTPAIARALRRAWSEYVYLVNNLMSHRSPG